MKKNQLLLLLFSFICVTHVSAGVEYGVFALTDGWYQVRARSSVAYIGNPANQIGNSQVTIKFPTNSSNILQVANDNLIWSKDVTIDFQTDDPGFTYISFATIGGSLDMPANAEINLFRFRNTLMCTEPITLLDHQTDHYYLNSLLPSGNSVGNNPGNNFFQLFSGEVYAGNYRQVAYCYGYQADLEASLSASITQPTPGDNFYYSLHILNKGPQPATGVRVRALLPSGVNFIGASGDGNYTPATGIWAVPALAANGSATLRIDARVTIRETLLMIMEVTSSDLPDPDSVPDNNVAAEDDQAEVTLQTPLAIALTGFTVCALADAVELQWTTSAETDNLGFAIYRSEQDANSYIKITNTLIPAIPGSWQTKHYRYLDNTVQAGNKYYYQLADVDRSGLVTFHGPQFIRVLAPEQFTLQSSYPNPFNASTTIPVYLDKECLVVITLYDVKASQVKTLFSGALAAGFHRFYWDGTDIQNRPVASGIYFCTITTADQMRVQRLILSR